MSAVARSRLNVNAEPQKVLIVDANLKEVHELGNALRSRGYLPLEATSLEAAKRLWAAHHPQMLIADVRLGQFNGLQLLLRAKAERPSVRAVITCAFSDRVLEAETRRFGGAFLVKPVTPEDVVAALQFDQGSAPDVIRERRVGDRRQTIIPGFSPERRVSNRRGSDSY